MARSLIPNSTQIPDIILDHWMAQLGGAEFKVLLYVARRTFGFGRDSDNISINQIARGIRRRDGTQLDHGTGLSRSGVKVACNALIGKGILIRSGNVAEDGREPEESTYRLNLYAAPPGRVGQKKAHLGQKMAGVGQKTEGGRPENGLGVGQNLALQETVIQETEQETAAATADIPPGPEPGADDAEFLLLVQELVSQGVGRSVAAELAREKPGVCRQCLEYLPFATVKRSKGAWLANAIRHEYGPPEAYVKSKQRSFGRKGEGTGPAESRISHAFDLQRKKTAWLRETYASMAKTQPEAILAFSAFADSERGKAEQVAGLLSPERRAQTLACWEGEERRLELFDRWLIATGRPSRAGRLPRQAPEDAEPPVRRREGTHA